MRETNDDLGGEEVGSRSLAEAYLLPVFRSRWLVATAVMLGTLGGFLYGASKPNQFTSVGKVLVRLGERERIRPDTVDDPRGGGGASHLLSDELHLLGNEAIYKHVAEAVGPKRILAPYDPATLYEESGPRYRAWMHGFQSWYFKQSGRAHDCVDDLCKECLFRAQHVLMARTLVAAARRSNVITVSYTAHDKTLVKLVVDALIREFDRRHQEVYNAGGAMQLLKQRQGEVLGEAALAHQELIRTHDKLGVVDLSKERSKLLDAQYDLDWQIAQVALELKLDARELGELEKELEPLEPVADAVRELTRVPNPAYTAGQEFINDLRRERMRLFEHYRPEAAIVLAKERLIAEEEGKLAKIEPEIEVEALTEERRNEKYEDLAAAIGKLRVRVANLTTTRTDKEALRSSTAGRLKYLRECELRLAELTMRWHILRRSAEESAATLESKRVLATLDQAKISNLVVLDWGSYPSGKSGPDRYKFLLIGTFVGLVGGLVLAFGRAMLDGTVRSTADVQRVSGLPVLATVRRKRGMPRRRSR